MQQGVKDYKELFAVGEMTELEKTLYGGDPYAERVGRMHYCVKTTKAGDALNVRIYPILGKSDAAKAESVKKALSPEKQKKQNDAKAQRRLRLLLEANFGAKDQHITLTYAGEAPTYSRAVKDIENFIARVRRLRMRKGLKEMKYLWVLEAEDNGEKRRIHCHMVLSGGLSREELESKWGKGFANADRLQPDAVEGLGALAKYLCKSTREKYQRKWSCSKNLTKPQPTISRTKMSNRRVRRVCSALPGEAAQVMTQVYPGYRLSECKVWLSEWISGVYVEVWMRRG